MQFFFFGMGFTTHPSPWSLSLSAPHIYIYVLTQQRGSTERLEERFWSPE